VLLVPTGLKSSEAFDMPPLQIIEGDPAQGPAAETLKKAPFNIFKGMVHNPGVMGGLMPLSEAISKRKRPSPAESEAVMLRGSERNDCGYGLTAHSAIAQKHGIDATASRAYRRGGAESGREKDMFQFVDAVVEVIAAIAWMTSTNLFNHVNGTELDFPAVPAMTSV